MTIRRNASWQDRVDERILELLYDEPWSVPPVMEVELPIEVTENQIRDRCKVLADAGLISIQPSEGWMVEITTQGMLYVDGGADIELYPKPRPPQSIDLEERS